MESLDYSKEVTKKYREKRLKTAEKMKLDQRILRSLSEAWTVGEFERIYELGLAIKSALEIANDFFYDDQCHREIRLASNETEITRALIGGRHRKFA